MAGDIKRPKFLSVDSVLGSFGKRDKENPEKYRQYVRDGVDLDSPLNKRSHQVLLGSPRFLSEMQPVLNGVKIAKRGPKQAKRRRSLNALFKNIGEGSRVERNEVIKLAHLDYSYTLMEIGDHIGLHYTTVSKVINSR